MSTQVNIRGITDIEDPNYRYKMAKLNITPERALMMINNIPQVARDLGREPEMLVEFIKQKFGINLNYKNNKLKYSTKISSDDIHKALYEFIEMFVLCESCNLPETNMIIKKQDNTIEFICRACSHNILIQVDKLNVSKCIKKTCQAIISKNMKDCVKILH